MRLDWKVLLGFGVSGLLLWWLFRDQDIGPLWAQIRQARPGLFLMAVAVATSAYLIRAVRWGILLEPVHPGTSLYNRFATTFIGFMANNLLPARMGEVVRAFALSKVTSAPMSGVFGTLVVARFLDAVAIFSLMGVAVLLPSFPADSQVGGISLGAVARVGGTMLLAGVVGIGVLVQWPRGPLELVRRVAGFAGPERAERVTAVAASFMAGLASLREPRLFGTALLLSLVHWIYYAWSFLLAFRAFGIELGYGAALVVQGIVTVGVAIPSAPGFFGTWHGAAQVALAGTYGVPETTALAFATAFHLGGFIPVTLIGLYYAWRLRIRVASVADRAEAP